MMDYSVKRVEYWYHNQLCRNYDKGHCTGSRCMRCTRKETVFFCGVDTLNTVERSGDRDDVGGVQT
jgi:hypothetical protein